MNIRPGRNAQAFINTRLQCFCKYAYFYCYIGFIVDGEGWQTHFDCVSGQAGANLQMDATFWGDADHTFVIGEDTYRVYADKTRGTETEFWGCLGVTRNVEA